MLKLIQRDRRFTKWVYTSHLGHDFYTFIVDYQTGNLDVRTLIINELAE